MDDQGNNLIVDEVMIGPEKAQESRELLQSNDLYVVGLMAPSRVLETRERARGDRAIGLARGQYDLVHRNIVYDLEADTAAATPVQCARAICNAFGLDAYSRNGQATAASDASRIFAIPLSPASLNEDMP